MRCAVVPCGSASVGLSLGQMVANKRFKRPTCIFLDGDSSTGSGCVLLPGNDAPERVVFRSLRENGWRDVWARISRDTSLVSDACMKAMTLPDHHEWTTFAATQLRCSRESLWRAMCAEWAKGLPPNEADKVITPITDALP